MDEEQAHQQEESVGCPVVQAMLVDREIGSLSGGDEILRQTWW